MLSFSLLICFVLLPHFRVKLITSKVINMLTSKPVLLSVRSSRHGRARTSRKLPAIQKYNRQITEISEENSCDNCKMLFERGEKPLFTRDHRHLCSICFDQDMAPICKSCNVPINEHSQKHKFFSSRDGSKFWHDYCIQCSRCNGLILKVSSRIQTDKGLFCPKCYDETLGHRCYTCRMIIFKKSQNQHEVSSKDGKFHWHKECFSCDGCGVSLVKNKYYCHENNLTFCPECYDVKIGSVCYKCNKLIRAYSSKEKKFVMSNGSFWHVDCLKCDDCGQDLASGSVYNLADDPLCATCYDAKTAVLCAHCKKHINTQSEGHKKFSSEDNETHWHDYCLSCWQCNRSLAGKTLYWRDGRMFCFICKSNYQHLKINLYKLEIGGN